MRNWVAVLAAAVVVAGCSQNVGGQSQPSKLTPLPSPSARPSSTSSAPATAAPGPDTPIDNVVAWIQAGAPADAAGFHTATRDGTETQLGDDVAFASPSGKTKCITDSQYSSGALACMVKFVNPPPRPPNFPTAWIGNWVDFDGQSILVGSPHGDPGPFVKGDGAQLPYGQTLKFGDYQCRSDEAGMYCANFAHQSAVRLSDGGVVAFGCAKQVTPPPDIGEKYVC
jgi:hypothetical protein